MTVCWYPNGEWKGDELKIFGIFISQWKTESYNDVWSTLFQERISHTNILPLLSFFLLHLYLITVDIHSMKHTNSLQSSSCLKKRKVVWFLIFFYNKGKFRGSFHDYLSSYFRLVWILHSKVCASFIEFNGKIHKFSDRLLWWSILIYQQFFKDCKDLGKGHTE